MSDRARVALAAVVLVVHGAASAHAQADRADLRYVAPLPATVTFTTVDSIRNTMGGLPTGDMTSTGAIRVVDELRFTPGDDGVVVTAVLKQMSGEMATPMGPMPMDFDERPPVEFTIRSVGPDPLGWSATPFQLPGAGVSELVTSRMAAARLIALPGRALSVGESWVDTVRLSPGDPQPVEGFEMEMVVASRGTYAGDTIVAGRTLNILRITSEMTANGSGTIQGMDATQDMTSTSEATVLWDSELHIPVFTDAVVEMRAESVVSGLGVPIRMDGRSRSITSAEVER